MTSNQANLLTKDNLTIFYRKYTPKNKSNNIVIFIHGWGDHSGTTEEFNLFLCKNKYNVYSLDLRGHGHSDGNRGYVESWDHYLIDVLTLYDHILTEFNKPNIYLVGLSMGGLVIALLLSQHQDLKYIKGMVMVSPLLELAFKPNAIKKFVATFMSNICPKLSLPNVLKISDITLDEEIQNIRLNDPLQHSMANSRWFTEMYDAKEKVKSLFHLIKIPTCICHSTDDKINLFETSHKYYESLQLKKKSFFEYKNSEHGLLYSTIRSKVFKDILSFLSK